MPDNRKSGKIELQHSEVEDILGRVPRWITRNGIVLFLFLLALLIFASWVFRYPDIKRAAIVVTSVNPPADLEARTGGKIVKLFVVDNQTVDKGEMLAMIENPAEFDDVMRLKEGLAFLDTVPVSEVDREIPDMRNADLGTIQTNYSMFLKAFKDLQEFRRLDYHQKKIELLRSELQKQRLYANSLSERAGILEEYYKIAERQFTRDATLYEEGVVSESSLEESRADMLSKRNDWHEVLSLVADNNITLARTQQEIVELELKQQEEQSQLVNILEESFNNLKASIASWEQNYILEAPISGVVTFNRFWSENQNVKAGEKVMTIIPAHAGSIVGKIRLPLEGAGKVKIGDQVNIRFDNYPYMEYGMVKGYVSNISKVPEDDFYTVEVELPSGLRTYYGKEIVFSQNMQGQAEILTDKMRFLDRVLNPIRSAIAKQMEM